MKSRMKDYPTSLSTPIDQTAARVISKGEHFTPNQNFTTQTWDAPPLTVPTPHECQNLIGSKQDDMTIIGCLNDSLLLARCVCGRYEPRKISKWRKGKGVAENKCQYCNYKRHLKRKSAFTRTECGR